MKKNAEIAVCNNLTRKKIPMEIKKYFQQGLIIYGYMFLILIFIDYFYPIFELVQNSKLYLIILFILIIIGRKLLRR